jgi:hypothetical protein
LDAANARLAPSKPVSPSELDASDEAKARDEVRFKNVLRESSSWLQFLIILFLYYLFIDEKYRLVATTTVV